MSPPDATLSAFEVRSYEVDSYRHLNNGVYLGWFEQGRLDWLRARGFSYDSLADRGQWLVVVRTEVDFRAALHTGDRVVVSTLVEGLGRTSVRYRQRMERAGADGAPTGAVAAEAATVMAFTDTRQAIPVPDDFRAAAGVD